MYVDAAFEVHNYMRIHTGGFMKMGTLGNYVQSSKQILNTNSSTEANLLRVDDILTQVIWDQYFLKEHGYEIHNNVIYKDNQSAIKLKNNGRRSSINQERHINIRYYFITDIITKKEVSM